VYFFSGFKWELYIALGNIWNSRRFLSTWELRLVLFFVSFLFIISVKVMDKVPRDLTDTTITLTADAYNEYIIIPICFSERYILLTHVEVFSFK